jgi:hypothetical protein
MNRKTSVGLNSFLFGQASIYFHITRLKSNNLGCVDIYLNYCFVHTLSLGMPVGISFKVGGQKVTFRPEFVP